MWLQVTLPSKPNFNFGLQMLNIFARSSRRFIFSLSGFGHFHQSLSQMKLCHGSSNQCHVPQMCHRIGSVVSKALKGYNVHELQIPHLTPGVQPHCWWSIWHHRTHRCHFGQLSLPVNYRSPWFQNQKTMILSCNSLITYGWWSRSHLQVGVYKGCNFLAKMANLTKSCTNSSDTVFVFSSPRVCLHLGHLSSGQFPLLWFQSVVYKWPHHYLRITSHLVTFCNLLNTQTCLK